MSETPRDSGSRSQSENAERSGAVEGEARQSGGATSVASPKLNRTNHPSQTRGITPQCSDCGKGITRGSRSGKCFECYHGSGQRDADQAARGSAMLRDAILAYAARQMGRAAA